MWWNNNKYLNDKYNFYHLDVYGDKEQIIDGDLCILKDVLQHWTNEQIYNFLDYITINNLITDGFYDYFGDLNLKFRGFDNFLIQV